MAGEPGAIGARAGADHRGVRGGETREHEAGVTARSESFEWNVAEAPRDPGVSQCVEGVRPASWARPRRIGYRRSSLNGRSRRSPGDWPEGTLDGARRAGAAGPARARDMSGGLLRRVAGRRVLPLPEGDPGRSRPALSPPEDPPLEALEAREERVGDGHHEADEGNGERGVVGALGKGEEVAQSAARGDELADDGPGEGEPHGDLQAPEEPGSDRRDVDLADEVQPRAAERAHAVHEPRVDLADAGVHGEEDGDRHEEEAEGHLGGHADAEPDDEEGREDDARDGVEEGHGGLEELREGRPERRGGPEDASCDYPHG